MLAQERFSGRWAKQRAVFVSVWLADMYESRTSCAEHDGENVFPKHGPFLHDEKHPSTCHGRDGCTFRTSPRACSPNSPSCASRSWVESYPRIVLLGTRSVAGDCSGRQI